MARSMQQAAHGAHSLISIAEHAKYGARGWRWHVMQVWDALPSIQNPVLIMNGTRDILVPQVNAERLAAHIPGAKLHLFQSWGHAFQDPAELAEVVTDFILDD